MFENVLEARECLFENVLEAREWAGGCVCVCVEGGRGAEGGLSAPEPWR